MPTHIATWNPARGVWETTALSVICEHLEPFSATWPKSGMTSDGEAFELPTLELPTNDSAYSLLPTPLTRDWKDGRHSPNVPVNGMLGRAVWALLPTPTTSSARGAGEHGEGSPNLQTVIAGLIGSSTAERSTDGPEWSDDPLPLPELTADSLLASQSG